MALVLRSQPDGRSDRRVPLGVAPGRINDSHLIPAILGLHHRGTLFERHLVFSENGKDFCGRHLTRESLLMSDETVIRVENLGKRYRLRHQAERQRYVALRDVIADRSKTIARRLWSAVRGPWSGGPVVRWSGGPSS